MKQAKPTSRLGTEPIGKLLLGYSIPAITTMTVVSLYNIFSSIFIGRGVGPLAITGLAVTFPLFNLIMAVNMLVAVGGATVSSIALGAKNPARAAKVLGHDVILSLIFATAFAIFSLIFLDPILSLFGASEVTLPYAREYMEVILWGAPLSSLMLALNHLMRATGYPARSMVINLISVGSNLIATPILIFGFGWGMRGAAWATIFSQVLALICMLAHFRNQDSTVHFQPGIFRLEKPVAKAMLKIGLAPFLMNACGCLVIVIINLTLRAHGGDMAIGAYGIANRLLMLFGMIIVGLSQGMQPLIGYNFGARRMDRVNKTLKYGIITATIITSSGFLAGQFIPGVLAGMFTDHQPLIELAAGGIRLSTMAFMLVGSQIIISSYFQSMGKASIAIFMSLSRQLLFLIPGLLILPEFFGLNGVWMSLPVADVSASVISICILIYTYRNKQSSCLPEDPDCYLPGEGRKAES